MMLSELLANLSELNIHFYVENGHLRCKAPRHSLTAEIKQQLSERKQELIELLSAGDTYDGGKITRVTRNQAIPLSYAQQRLWFLDQLEPGNAFYNIPIALRLVGQLNELALAQSINEIVRRHENLRTTFATINGQAEQCIADTLFVPIEAIDLAGLTEPLQSSQARQLCQQEANFPFDLAAGPLLRVRLIRLSEDGNEQQAILLVTLHHIISDGWSSGILTSEFVNLYEAYNEGKPSPLAELNVQYADFAYWQRQWLNGAVLHQQTDYWRLKLGGAPALLELPTDHPRPAEMRYQGANFQFNVPASLTAQIHELSRQHHATLFVTLLTFFSVLLSRYSQQTDLCIGIQVANRNRLEIEALIGFFVNTLVIRVDLSDASTIVDLLAQIKNTVLEAQAHQDLPFEQLVGCLNPERSMRHSPLFQVSFSLENNTGNSVKAISGLSISGIEGEGITAKFDLSLDVNQGENGLMCAIEYNTDLFEMTTITRMAQHYLNLLQGIVEQPEKPLWQLPLLTDDERQQLLFKFNSASVSYPEAYCVHQLFERQVEQTPDAPAVVCAGRSLSYAELNAQANQLAHHLRSKGVKPEMLVGICVGRSLAMVVCALAVLKAGGAYLPLDPDLPEERLQYLVADSNAAITLTQDLLMLPPCHGQCIDLTAQSSQINSQPTTNLGNLTHPGHLAYVIYTSGSTDQPKGVMISHANLVNAYFAWQDAYQLGTMPRAHLQMANFSFDVFTGDLVRALLSGDKLVLCPRSLLLDPPSLYSLLCDEQIKVAEFVPAVLRNLLQYLEKAHKTLSFMDLLICGSDIWGKEDHQKTQAYCNGGTRLIQSYGLTEATIDSSYYENQSGHLQSELLPIGHPFANTQIYLLDKALNNLPIGAIGELHIAGAGLARGYLNHPQLTAEKFIPNPFAAKPGDRLYKTGDLGRYLPDGDIEFLGRNDFQVKIRGFRIEPGEIEAQLANCPGVREAVVIAREDSSGDKGGDKRLVAYLLAEDGHALSAAGLRAQLANVLADHLLPSAYVTLSEYPLTPNGKLDRKALPAPDSGSVITRPYEAPQSHIENILTGIWQDLLQLDQVGRYDHFFELGGHSLLAVTLIERLRQQGLTAAVRNVFTTPVLADMAAAIGADQPQQAIAITPPNLIPDGCTAITPDMLPLVALSQAEIDSLSGNVQGGAANIQDIYPLAPLQEGILFHHLLETVGDTYLSRSVITFSSRNRLDAFLDALQIVINRHDILRSSIHWAGLSKPVQIVHRHASISVEELTLDQENKVLPQLLALTDPRQKRLNLQHAPLITATIAEDLHANEWLLVLLNHHLISDHLAVDLIITEIQKIIQGEKDSLPDALPYRNFIAQALSIPVTEHETYFRKQLGDIDEPTAPFGVLDIQSEGLEPVESSLKLTNGLAQEITDCAHKQGVAAAVLFHVAWAQVLAQCTGRNDVVFGTVLLGRLQASVDTASIIGMFINTLPVCIRLANKNVQQVVKETYACLTELLSHEQASLVLAQRCSAVSVGTPLFTSLLNYRHSSATVEASLTAQSAWEGIRILPGETRTNYPLALSVDDLGNGFSITAQCVQGIDPERIVAYLCTAIKGLVDTLNRNARQQINKLSILPDSERYQLLEKFNDTAVDYANEQLIHQLLEAQVEQYRDVIALVFEGQSLSYGELNRRANQLAHYLIALGIRPDDRVAIYVERGLDMVVGLLGILKAGGAYVPLASTSPQERLMYMLVDCAPTALLTQIDLAENLSGITPPDLPVIFLDTNTSQVGMQSEIFGVAAVKMAAFTDYPDTNPDLAKLGLTSHHLAYIIYTSGSTGQPKGVMVAHKSAVNFWHVLTATTYRHCPANAKVALNAAHFFDMSLKGILQLLSGHTLYLVPENIRADGNAFLQFLAAHQIDAFDCTPSQLELLLNAGLATKPEYQPKSVLIGGEAIAQKMWDTLKQAEAINFYNMYGPTECTVDATIAHIRASDETPHIGRPIANTQIYLLDANLQPVPLGVAGEIYIGGAGVARGYLNRPGLTAERFIADPYSDTLHARLYQTGDLGRWLPDGNIEYLGRNDFQVKIRGFRIELGEIEAQLAKCPGIKEAVVIAREDSPGDQRLVAYLIAEAGQEPSISVLRAQLAIHLADYMLPGAFVVLDRFPLTPNGKLDRKALPAPDGGSVVSKPFEAPKEGTETVLAGIWQDLLHLHRVGRHDHFFELGGHSLLAVQLVSRIRQDLGLELPLRDVFAQPVLSGLAQAVAGAQGSTLPPIRPRDPSQPIPLSWAQQRLWFLAQLDPAASVAYHMPIRLRLTGVLDKAALKAALDRIVARHEALRTRFAGTGHGPRQTIAPADSGFYLTGHDLTALDSGPQQAAAAQLARSEAAEPFNLSTGPLIRGRLLELGATDHILLLTQHHLISDAWSLGRLTHEFAVLYSAYRQGQPDPLPELGLQYPDYAAWQRQWLQGDILQAQLDYWRGQLTGAPALLGLPTDHPRPAQQSYRGGNYSLGLSAELSCGLKDYSQRRGATLFMTLLTGWAILMARLSGQTDLVIGTPVANRQQAELEGLIGFFVNTLALRVRLDGDPRACDLLDQIKTSTLSAYAHQDLPFEQLVEALNPPRSMSHSPVFQVLLSLDNTPGGALELPGLTLGGYGQVQATAHFDLALSLTEQGGRITGSLQYAADLFEPGTIQRLAGHYQTLLEGLIADDRQAVSRLPLLGQEQRRQLLYGFNATHADYPHSQCIHQLFERQADQHPDAIALVYQEQTLSYGQLNRRANQLAHRLIVLGIQPDDRVAICVERGLDMVAGLLGILKAGGAYVPLDPGYPEERLAYLIEDSDPAALLTQSQVQWELSVLTGLSIPIILLNGQTNQGTHLHEDVDASPTVYAGYPEHNPDPQALGLTSANLAYIIYTSGSTGKPKGVMVEHLAIANFLCSMSKTPGISSSDTMLAVTTLSFDIAALELFLPLLCGAKVVLTDRSIVANAELLQNVIRQNNITIMQATPATWRMLLSGGWKGSNNLKALCGGEALANDLCQHLVKSVRELWNLYGPTETTVWSTCRLIAPDPSEFYAYQTIGYPIANTQIYILDTNLQPVPVGVTGEIYIGGAGVARGYFNRPELTAERFLADPYGNVPDARLYKTGDLGRWLPGGNLEYLGRNDFQVKIRGFRIELGEIEAQLANCTSVKEAVVIAREDRPGDKRLIAYLTVQDNAEPTPADLRDRLSSVLADYMLPSAFVVMESFPLTPNGKLDRKALPAPDGGSVVAKPFEAPKEGTETIIAELWQELLHFDHIGRHDNFFDLGGHSLLATQIASRLSAKFNIEFPLIFVFQAMTVKELAAKIEIAVWEKSNQDRSQIVSDTDSGEI